MDRIYKESGIEWIGKIPDTWEIKRLKEIFVERNNRDAKGKTLLSVSQYYGIKPKAETDIADSHVAESYDDYKVVFSGDFVMNIMLAWNGSYAVSDYEGIVSPAYCVYQFRKNSCHKFFHYLLRIDGYQTAFKTMSRGIIDSRLRLYPEQFYTFNTIFPPLQEQQHIADYLDDKCVEIDSLIGLQEQMIEKLKAYKQSVITEAVTKGLDPNAKLVPSGIDWIGVIPEGWNITVLRRFANIILGKMLQPNARSENDSIEQYICAKDVHFEGIDTSDLKKMYFNKTEKEIYQVQKGDLLVVEGGAGAAGSCVLKTDLPNTYIQNSIMIVRPKQGIDIRYIHYFEFSLVKKGYVDYVCNKATIPHFTKDKLSSMPIPLPPLSEQQAIPSYLDEKCADIDRLITLKQRKIESLKDYKKSVIYEAVTGKTIIE
jgi:type I restriction enzyme S subunit